MLDTNAFREFLTEGQLDTLGKILREVNSLADVRKTAVGRITAAGSMPLPGVMEVVDNLSGLDPNNMLQALADDANGTAVFILPERENQKEKKRKKNSKKKPLVFAANGDGTQFVQQVHCNGEPIIVGEVREERDKENIRTLIFRIMPVWLFDGKGERYTWNIRLQIPHLKMRTLDGHANVGFPERQARFFRPRYIWENNQLSLQLVNAYFQEAIVAELKELPSRVSARSKSSGKQVEEMLNRAVARALVALPMQEEMADLVMRFEFEVVIRGAKTITEKWRMREMALKELVGTHNINCTSKNHPGDIITKKGPGGVPPFVLAINPFGYYTDPKRLPEMREIKKCLELAYPTALSVKALGVGVPDVLSNRVRELNVAVFDCPYNYHDGSTMGDDFCHDTLLGLPPFMEKMKILKQRFEFTDPEELEEMKTRLAEMGIFSDSIEETAIRRDLDNGMFINIWRLDVIMNKEDLGKVKSIGALKGVPYLMTFRLYAIEPDGTRKELDLVIPEATFRKKKCLDATLYMMAVKAGVKEVDASTMSEEGLLDLVQSLAEPMKENGYRMDLKQEVVIVFEDGTEDSLGEVTVGVLPFYRPVQTGFGQFRDRGMRNGINIHLHDLQMVSVTHDLSRQSKRRFAQLVQAIREVEKTTFEDKPDWSLERPMEYDDNPMETGGVCDYEQYF